MSYAARGIVCACVSVCVRVWAGGWNGDSRKRKVEELRRTCPLPTGTPRLTDFLKNSFFLGLDCQGLVLSGVVVKAAPSGWVFISCY